jgi:hypothetical protein
MVTCLTAARFTMVAEVLHWQGRTDHEETDTSPEPAGGHYETYQDPITGELLNDWVPGTPDNTDTPDTDESAIVRTIPCLARGIVDGGIRVAGSTERFGDTYENIEFAKLWVPQRIKLFKNDRITNIRAKRGGEVIWTEADGSPVVFNVNGISPLFDAFNRPVEKFILLERASE